MRFSILAITLLLPFGFLFTYPDHAMAQAGICGDTPQLRDERLKGEIDSKASVLSRYVGDVKFKGQVEFEKNEVLSRYPNADKLLLNQYYMYQVCILIMSDSRMTTEKKLSFLQMPENQFSIPVPNDRIGSYRNLSN